MKKSTAEAMIQSFFSARREEEASEISATDEQVLAAKKKRYAHVGRPPKNAQRVTTDRRTTVILPAALIADIKMIAIRQECTVTDIMRECLRKFVDDYKRNHN